MQIRAARLTDAEAACYLLRRSITELCREDHRDDPAILKAWLSNKTPASVGSWIADANNHVLVAIENDVVIGVAAVTRRGEILLNYVLPEARFRGVSKALLRHMESIAKTEGNAACTLTSTATARRFYLSAGYIDREAPDAPASHPMIKKLAAS